MTQILTQTTPTRIMLTNTMSKMTKNIQVGVAMIISGRAGFNLKRVQSRFTLQQGDPLRHITVERSSEKKRWHPEPAHYVTVWLFSLGCIEGR